MTGWIPIPLRLSVGTVFVVKGWWLLFVDFNRRVEALAQFGIPGSWWIALFLGVMEIFGGLGLILGLYFRWCALLLLVIEIIAIGPVHLARGFLTGSAFNLLLMGSLISLVLSGPGKFSLRN